MKRVCTLIIIISMLLISCNNENISIKEEEILETNQELDKINLKIKSMTIDEKIGELMFLGFEEDQYDKNLETMLEDLKPGGLIFFKRNIKDISSVQGLIKDIKLDRNGKNIFLAVDEEGGEVSRLSDILEPTPSFKEVGEFSDEYLTSELSKIISKKLMYLGFNTNMGPVLDIRTNKSNTITKTRSFSSNKDIVSQLGRAYIIEAKKQGLVSIAKHFPGHGDSTTDPHFNLPIVNKSKELIYEEELKPFKEAIDLDIPAIMINHVLYTSLDNKYPASQSKIIINDILRKELKYENIIISDDLTMLAITNSQEPEKAALRFIQAGGDMALLCHGNNIGYHFKEEVLRALNNGSLTEEEINAKVYRILNIKDKYKPQEITTDSQKINEEIKEYKNNLKDFSKIVSEIRSE